MAAGRRALIEGRAQQGPLARAGGPRVTPLQNSDALRRAAPGGPVPRHLAPAGAMILRTATDGSRSRDTWMCWGAVEGGRRAAPSSAAGQLRCACYNTPSFNLPCDRVIAL